MKFKITKVYKEKSELTDEFNYYADIKFEDGEKAFICLNSNPSNEEITKMATDAYNEIMKAHEEKADRKTFLGKLTSRLKDLTLKMETRK